MSRVIISAGHTKDNPGISINNLEEYTLAKEIAGLITPKLRNNGLITLAVPVGVSEEQRIKWINTTGYSADLDDILIEIHFHSDSKSGIKIWYEDTEDSNSKKIAEKINKKLEDVLKVKTLSIDSQKNHPEKNLPIITKTKPKGVVIECLSLENDKDRELLSEKSTLKKIAESISKAILEYFGTSQLSEASNLMSDATEIKSKTTQEKIKKTEIPPIKEEVPKLSSEDPFSFDNDPFGLPPSTLKELDNSSGSSSKKMTRDERKEMIKKYYKKAFGEEPETSDLNYFLNIGISEEQLLKRILESEEHKNQVESAIKYREIKSKHDKISTELSSLKNNLEDQKKILDKLNKLLDEKNKYLSKLQQRVQILLSRVDEYRNSQGEVREKVDYQQNTLERFFSFLASRLG